VVDEVLEATQVMSKVISSTTQKFIRRYIAATATRTETESREGMVACEIELLQLLSERNRGSRQCPAASQKDNVSAKNTCNLHQMNFLIHG
jgi:hypothetical protein